jgi:hypothetical protein
MLLPRWTERAGFIRDMDLRWIFMASDEAETPEAATEAVEDAEPLQMYVLVTKLGLDTFS